MQFSHGHGIDIYFDEKSTDRPIIAGSAGEKKHPEKTQGANAFRISQFSPYSPEGF